MATRILVVDDEFDTLELLRTILELSDFDPITTLNSVEAVELAKATKPDVALLDIMMPELDGFTLCKMMRQDPVTANLPIIFVTAYEALDLEQRRREAGADRVINKPIDLDVLITSIKQVLDERAARPADGSKAPADAANTNAPPPPKPDESSAQ